MHGRHWKHCTDTLQLNLEALIRGKGCVFLEPFGLIVMVPSKEEPFSTKLTGI